ncbi:E3 ubiquitin-protein ligase pellino homolog 1 [Ictalurus punctatus]|uniref:E3 ubiquitin-protein ligase pellino homolog 1 n=1 Tax=Ictalurus punctatus TaxID=7998 RepID=A0A2D0Q2R1_ICTPU|nr:E3 ubiquitin-protein ligase pellino homolog 1 [Ictalurus punctatus]XP_053532070.1 E3 ubiquitin-protein ligase pellino homolog 1 [Ictalurus punctatus]
MLNLEEEPIKYGELIVLGCNGSFPGGNRGRRKSRFSLYRRDRANGVKPGTVHIARSPEAAKVISNNSQHSVSYALSDIETVVVEYTDDNDTDMFQIGRCTESPIDIVVANPAGCSQSNGYSGCSQSTISRFACRIVCERAPPYTARVYAAGFDCSRNIFLGEKAAKWRSFGGQMDGLTTNGVLVMRPKGEFSGSSEPGVWREISVCGNVHTLRPTRAAQSKGQQVMDESPVLVDGSLIDLCGVTLLWRAAAALSGSPGPEHLEELRMKLNAARPHCPVLLHTLAFPSLDDPESNQPRQPWVYLCCGHVHGFHPWRGRGTAIKHEEEKEENEEDVMKGAREGDKERECPLCRARGLYVPLTLGRESRLCVDAGPPSHVFVPCGHVCSEATAVYWSKTPLPCGASSFYSACPFCMKQLARDRPYVTLIFQGAPD